MSKKRKNKHKKYVDHPRYGDKPGYSGNEYSREAILESYWGYGRETIFPDSAIPANTDNQNYSIFPRSIYVDIEKKCRQCGRPFIFYAREQKYWYEDLHFYIDADCVKCIQCRKKEQSLKSLIFEYEKLTGKPNRSNEETSRLKQLALELLDAGYITNENKINTIT